MINETAVGIVRSSRKLKIQKIMINDIAVGLADLDKWGSLW